MRLEDKDMLKGNKPRVILDTNLLLSAIISPRGNPNKAIRAWGKDSYVLLISAENLKELNDVTSRKKFLDKYSLFSQRKDELIDSLMLAAEVITQLPVEDLPVHSRDPDDDYLLAAALGGSADYLVTGDEDLLELNDHPDLGDLNIITVKEFIELL